MKGLDIRLKDYNKLLLEARNLTNVMETKYAENGLLVTYEPCIKKPEIGGMRIAMKFTFYDIDGRPFDTLETKSIITDIDSLVNEMKTMCWDYLKEQFD